MRLPLLTLAALAALAPPPARGEDAVAPKGRLEAGVEQREAASKEEAVLQEGIEARAAIAARRAERASGMPRLGLAVAGGFPDFATASLVYRPVSHVRLSAGPAWNYVGWGAQGGVAVVPWSFWIAPVLSIEAGRFFGTNLGFLAKDSGGVPQEMKPLLGRIDYSYAALDVGLELGSPRGFSVSIRLGLSYVSIAAHGTATHTSDDGSVVSMTNPALHGTLPSLKLGFQYWL